MSSIRISTKARKQVYARDRGRCFRCTHPVQIREVHHRQPRGMGGTRLASSTSPANLVLLTNRTLIGVDWGAWVVKNQAAHGKMIVEVLNEIGKGTLRPVEPVSYPMSQAAQALRDMQNRKIAGKVALVPDF